MYRLSVRNSRRPFIILAVAALSAAFLVTLTHAAGASFFQGFETDSSGWFGSVTRVASGTNGVGSASGSYHAEAADNSAFTRWGGYGGIAGCSGNGCAAQFPQHGYVTSVDIWLDPAAGPANDTRFDFSSAINDPSGAHRRDFVFNAGFYNDTDATGAGPRFVISASNNAGRSSSFPKNPGRSPYTITDEGWYTFQHTFRDNGGVLAVDLSIKNASGVTLKIWTLSDPTDTINGTVGNNRYGWFVQQEFPFLAIDNTSRTDIMFPPADKEQCKNDGWKMVVNGEGQPFKNQGQCVKFITAGK